MSVPLLSCDDLLGVNRDKTIQLLGDAFIKYGFVRIKNYDIPKKLIDDAFQQSKGFFELNSETKDSYCIKGGQGQRGYTPKLQEVAKGENIPDLKEFWHVGRELDEGEKYSNLYPKNVWPKEMDNFRPTILSIYNALDQISVLILEALAIYLGEEKNRLTSIADGGNSILRLLHYPPLNSFERTEGAIRAAAHGDINLITLLMSASTSGLELLTREGEWIPVLNGPDEIIADAGDMLERITNKRIPATIHRVVNPDNSNTPRYSMPFFVHPRPDAVLSVLESCKGEGFPKPPEDITGMDFLQERLSEIGLANM